MDYESLRRMQGSLETPVDLVAGIPVVNKIVKDIPGNFNASERWPKCTSIGEIRD